MSRSRAKVIWLLSSFFGLMVFQTGCVSYNSYKLPTSVNSSTATLVFRQSNWLSTSKLLIAKVNSSGPSNWQKPTGREDAHDGYFGSKADSLRLFLFGKESDGSCIIEIPTGLTKLTARIWTPASSGFSDYSAPGYGPGWKVCSSSPDSLGPSFLVSFVAESGHTYKMALDKGLRLEIQDITDKAHPQKVKITIEDLIKELY